MKRPPAGKAAAKRRHDRALAAGDKLGEILSDGVGAMFARIEREFRSRAMAAGQPTMVASAATFGVDDLPTPQVASVGADAVLTPALDLSWIWNSGAWEQVLDETGDFIGQFIIAELDLELGLDLAKQEPLVQEVVASHVAQIDDWGMEMKATVRQVVEQGFRESMSVQQVAEKLAATGVAGERRALSISRTTMIGSSNGASYRATKAISEPGDRRRWLATSDHRTRDSHRKANGQEVGFAEEFTVGGAKLAYPGDPAGPAREVVACRCTTVFVPGD